MKYSRSAVKPRTTLLIVALSAFPALYAQKPVFDTVLYGAAYYHEYMPYERLDKDVEMMQKAGITVVRVGESSWSSWEPRDGEFEYAWMERILDRLHKAGIKVILGTPTYSIPPWLYKKHPEILVTHLDGSKATYGIRQNMDISNPTYCYYSERVIRNVVSHFKNHPAIIGFQVDNETSSYGAAGPSVQQGFVEYLQKKFKTTAELNRIWGFVYWGQLVNDWSELPPRDGIRNPGYKLEWERYQHSMTTNFLAWQAAIVREYKRPDQFVTHDFEGGARAHIDQYQIAGHLDITGVNPYHDVQDRLDGEAISLSGDVQRSLKHANYLVTETNAQGIGWDSKDQFPPYDGQLRLNVYSHIASGANMIEYWHWHSLHYGQETYWKGVLSHDLEPNRTYTEVSRIGNELKKVGPRIVNFERRSDVGILFSTDSYHAIEYMPFGDKVNYMTVLNQMYDTLYRMNISTDFVFPENPDFARYKVIVVPPLYSASDDLLKKLAEYVNSGGHVVMAFKSGFTNEYSTVRWERQPGQLRAVAGVSYQEFSTLREQLPLKGELIQGGKGDTVSVWAEMLLPEGAQVLASYDHPFFGKYAAITRNRYGKGTLTYEGAYLSPELQAKVMRQVLAQAGLTGPDQSLPAPVRVRHGKGNTGKTLHFYLNYSGQTQEFQNSYGAGTDLLTGKAVEKGGSMSLGAWEVAVLEER
jgi:beta-galactosidase